MCVEPSGILDGKVNRLTSFLFFVCLLIVPTWLLLLVRSWGPVVGFLFNVRGVDGVAARGLVNDWGDGKGLMNGPWRVVHVGQIRDVVTLHTVNHRDGPLVKDL